MIKKVAIIGCGRIGALYDISKEKLLLTHAKGFTKAQNTKLIYAVDINEELAIKVSSEYSCKYLVDYKNLPLNDLDIICISVDTLYHFEILEYLYKNDYKGVLVLEKPVVKTFDEIEKLENFDRGFLNRIFVNYIRRFDKDYIDFLRRIKSNEFSSLKHIQVNYFGEFEHNAIHAFNLLNYIFDKKPEVIYAENTLVILKYANVQVIFKQIKSNYYNYDLNFFTDTHKIVFDKLGYRVSIYKTCMSEKFDNTFELELVERKEVLNAYIVNLAQMIANENFDMLPTIYEGIRDLKWIKEIKECWQ